MSDRRDPDVHRLVMDWPDDAIAEIERLNRIINSGDTLRDHAIRKAMRERDEALARLAEEVKNKKEFERDWLAACDELCNTRSRLAEAEALLRVMPGYGLSAYDKERWEKARNAFLAADSATHRETANGG